MKSWLAIAALTGVMATHGAAHAQASRVLTPVDLNMMARVVEQGLSRANRYLVLRSQIPDKPGRLYGMLTHLSERRINVLDVRHNRAGWRIPLGWVEVELLVETRNAGHILEIIRSLKQAGYKVERAERDAR